MRKQSTLGVVANDRGFKVSSDGSLGIYDELGNLTLAYGPLSNSPSRLFFVDVRDGKKPEINAKDFPFELLL